MGGVRLLRWEKAEPPSVERVEGLLRSDGMSPSAWSNRPGDRYAEHAHGYEKVLYCSAGSITFELGDPSRQVELLPGDRLVLPPGTTHSAFVGPRGCTCVEGHRPG